MADSFSDFIINLIDWVVSAFIFLGGFCTCLLFILGLLAASGVKWANRLVADQFRGSRFL